MEEEVVIVVSLRVSVRHSLVVRFLFVGVWENSCARLVGVWAGMYYRQGSVDGMWPAWFQGRGIPCDIHALRGSEWAG